MHRPGLPMLTLVAVLVAVVLLPQTAGAVPVSTTEGDGAARPCPKLSITPPVGVDGGCTVRVRGSKGLFTVMSVVEELVFGVCNIDLTLHLGPSGRVLANEIESGCPDAQPCFLEEKHTEHIDAGTIPPLTFVPWRGDLVRGPGGGLRVTLDACMDTCMGRYDGRLVLDVDPRHARRPTRKMTIGSSGWSFTGVWKADLADLRVGEARPRQAAWRPLGTGTLVFPS